MVYPKQQLTKMIDISNQIKEMIEIEKPTHIVIEEIAGSKNRMGQKVLDGLHFIVLFHISDYLEIISFYDVTGKDGWRFHLDLKLSEEDKLRNKEAKKMNPKLAKKSQLPIVNAKDLAARYANKTYNLELNVQENQYDNDLADSISMGSSFLKIKYPKE